MRGGRAQHKVPIICSRMAGVTVLAATALPLLSFPVLASTHSDSLSIYKAASTSGARDQEGILMAAKRTLLVILLWFSSHSQSHFGPFLSELPTNMWLYVREHCYIISANLSLFIWLWQIRTHSSVARFFFWSFWSRMLHSLQICFAELDCRWRQYLMSPILQHYNLLCLFACTYFRMNEWERNDRSSRMRS